MKKIYTFAAALFCLLAVGCTRDIMSFSSFDLRDVNFTDDETKVHFVYSGSGSALSYDTTGTDHVYVNGAEFTVNYSGGTWTATGSSAVSAERFYCAYANGSVFDWNEGNKTYKFSLNLAATNGIVLAGNTDQHTLTLTPCCAIIRVPLGVTGYTVKVGFDPTSGGSGPSKIPSSAKINADSKQIIAEEISYLAGVTSGGAGDFLTFKEDASHNYYVGVPIVGSSVTTTLYLEWTKGGSTTKYKTSGQVTLEKGKVYTLGTTRVSPFDANGASLGEFLINDDEDAVAFSKGNLMCYKRDVIFCFPDNQYSMMEDQNNNIKKNKYNGLIDLYGWATSGYSTYSPALWTNDNSQYYSGSTNISGTNYDWGSNTIYMNSTLSATSSHSWRTLTKAEWTYLLGNNDNGLATITIGGVKYRGLIIAPYDVYNPNSTPRWRNWTCPAGVTFNTGTTNGWLTNNLSAADWAKLENSGVIFLPAAGWRSVDGSGDPKAQDFGEDGTGAEQKGRYWSATKGSGAYGSNAYRLEFTSSSITAANNEIRSDGCAVRLVTDVTW